MGEFGQERSIEAAVAPTPYLSAGPNRDPLQAWDRRSWLVMIPLALIVIYAFSPSLDNSFVRWDDHRNFLENPSFRGLGAAQLKWAWTTFWVGVYQPLAWMLFETQYVFWRLDPRGYHSTSLLLQLANAAVLYVLTVALLVRCRTDSCLESGWRCSLSAGLATALFAVHPLRVEAVAWISCQPYLPCALFSMLSVLAYLRAFGTSSSPRWGWLVGSFLLFVAALLFKAPAVSLPAVLLILDVYPLGRFPDETGRWLGASARRALLEKVPFVMTSLLFMGLAIAAKPQSQLPVHQDNASEGIARACYAIWFYIWKTVLPLDLIAFYPAPRELNWLAFSFSLSILATLGISAGLFLVRRRWPGLLAVWLSYLVILAPNSGIVWISNQIAADRYSYISMLGSVMLAAAGFCRLWRISSRWRPGAIGIIAMGVGALLGLSALTRNQCRTWRDTEVLWTHALNHGANTSFDVHNKLGSVLYAQGKYQEAEAHFAEALRLNPGFADVHNNVGVALQTKGSYREAEAHFTEALRLNPSYADAHANLGRLFFTQRKYEAAATHFTEAVRFNPGDADGHKNLGHLLSIQGKYEAAATRFTEAVRLNPGDADAHNNLAMIFFHQRKYPEAAAQFSEALPLNPANTDIHNNLGTVLARQKRYAEAAAHFAVAIRVDPGFVMAHFNLGLVQAQQGKYRDAAAHYIEAIRLQPGNVGAHLNLGNVLSRLGNYEAAQAHYSAAIQLDRGIAEAYNASALIMAACPEAKFRDGKGAVALATRGCELTKWKDPRFLNTLAAAQAEVGDFDAAVTSQKKAIELLTDQRQQDDYRSRLVLYQAQKPYRQISPQRAPSGASS